jgi:hypothetical protein
LNGDITESTARDQLGEMLRIPPMIDPVFRLQVRGTPASAATRLRTLRNAAVASVEL